MTFKLRWNPIWFKMLFKRKPAALVAKHTEYSDE